MTLRGIIWPASAGLSVRGQILVLPSRTGIYTYVDHTSNSALGASYIALAPLMQILFTTLLGHLLGMGGSPGTYVIRPFDPWRGRLCTCPFKFSFDPYTGCEHGCLYCYASSYIRDFHRCRAKEGLLSKVRRDLSRLPEDALISMSNSSDPYTRMEAELQLTRRCLREFIGRRVRLLIITKSDLVVRDIDLLLRLRSAVTITITTLDENLARRLEPGAPPPSRRLDAVSTLAESGVPVGVRIDPVIPFLTDEGIECLVKEVRGAGAAHVTASTLKPRIDGWRRMEQAFPEVCARLRPLYFEEGERVGRSLYLPRSIRLKLMRKIAEECARAGLTFATCREGFPELQTGGACDGSHLVENYSVWRGRGP